MNKLNHLPQRRITPLGNTRTVFRTKYSHRQWDTLHTQLQGFRIASTTWEHTHIRLQRAGRLRMESSSRPPDIPKAVRSVGPEIVHPFLLAALRSRLLLSDLFECASMS